MTSYYSAVDESIRTYMGLVHNAGTLKLYKNLGDGTFRDVTKETGLHKAFMPMGGNFGDLDNDGYPDIYMGTGNPSYSALLPNVLLRNKEGSHLSTSQLRPAQESCIKGMASPWPTSTTTAIWTF